MYNINSYFDKVYVITCDGFYERQSYIKSHFLKYHIKFEWFSSVNKENLAVKPVSTSNNSLTISHLQCIVNAKLNNLKRILICEDDICFRDDIETEFDKFVTDVPIDWDFLQLGNQFWASKFLNRVKYDKVYKFIWGTGSHCIGINNSVYDKVIKQLSILDHPADFLYYKAYEQSNCYCPENFMADALSTNDHVGYFDKKLIFKSTIIHPED